MRGCPISDVNERNIDELVRFASAPVFVYVGNRSCEACTFRPDASKPNAVFYCLKPRRSPGLLERLEVRHFPTILLFRHGRVIRRLVGQAFPDDLDLIVRLECAQMHRV